MSRLRLREVRLSGLAPSHHFVDIASSSSLLFLRFASLSQWLNLDEDTFYFTIWRSFLKPEVYKVSMHLIICNAAIWYYNFF